MSKIYLNDEKQEWRRKLVIDCYREGLFKLTKLPVRQMTKQEELEFYKKAQNEHDE